MGKSTRKRKSSKTTKNGKPSKPYPEFPLFPHSSGQWAKKIRGRMVYFGLLSDPQAALNKYLDEQHDLHAGRTPRIKDDELTVQYLVNHFLTQKRLLVDSGELAPRSWADYAGTGERIAKAFGKRRLVDDLAGDDFAHYRAALTKKWGPVAIGNEVQRVRSIFKHGYEAGLINKPMRFGPGFKRPSKKTLRKARAAKGPKMFTPFEIRAMAEGAVVVGENGPKLVQAGPQLRAMILLGVNCGFGNSDCGTLPLSALDLEGGWLTYARPKTGIERRAKLWPESVALLREALAKRPEPKDPADCGLTFITKYKSRWDKSSGGKATNPIYWETKKLLLVLGIHRPGLGFYTLRHVTETIGGEVRDQIALNHIMGHATDDMPSAYREKISDERLAAVAEHIHRWLYNSQGENAAVAPTNVDNHQEEE